MNRTTFLPLLLLLAVGCERHSASTTCSADGTCVLGEDREPPVITLDPPLETDGARVNLHSPGVTCDAVNCTLRIRPKLVDGGHAQLSAARLDDDNAPIDGADVLLVFPVTENGAPEHTLLLAATDGAGNTGRLARHFRVDVVPPVLTFTGLLAAGDYDCAGDLCTGAVVNAASLSATKTVMLSGVVSDPEATLLLALGDTTVGVAPNAAGAWSYEWAVGSGEVGVVARAIDASGNDAESARKVLVDTVTPTCTFPVANGARLVSRTTPLLTCSKEMSAASVQSALTLRPPPTQSYRAEGNSFFALGDLLFGNVAYALALNEGATDKAGNPAAALSQIVFRTAPVLPAGEQHLKGNYLYPRVAVDSDGLPFVFAWELSVARQEGRQVLFTWDGQGNGLDGRGAWTSKIPAFANGATLGPVRDFRLSTKTLDRNLGLVHAGRVLLSPVSVLGSSNSVSATYAESSDDLVTFHGASGVVAPDTLAAIVPGTTPAFFTVQTAEVGADGQWVVIEGSAAVILSTFTESYVAVFGWLPGWVANPALFSPIALTHLAQRQAGFVGDLYPPEMFPRRHVWHVPLGEVDAAIDPAIDIGVVAGLTSLFHALDGMTYEVAYVAWVEAQRHGSAPQVLRLGCKEPQAATPTWVVDAVADAPEIVGIDFGQGVSRVAIALDTAESDGRRYSRFGLLSGNACATSNAVNWDAAGAAVEGQNPTTAFSNDGVLWRVVEGAKELLILAPLKL